MQLHPVQVDLGVEPRRDASTRSLPSSRSSARSLDLMAHPFGAEPSSWRMRSECTGRPRRERARPDEMAKSALCVPDD